MHFDITDWNSNQKITFRYNIMRKWLSINLLLYHKVYVATVCSFSEIKPHCIRSPNSLNKITPWPLMQKKTKNKLISQVQSVSIIWSGTSTKLPTSLPKHTKRYVGQLYAAALSTVGSLSLDNVETTTMGTLNSLCKTPQVTVFLIFFCDCMKQWMLWCCHIISCLN